MHVEESGYISIFMNEIVCKLSFRKFLFL